MRDEIRFERPEADFWFAVQLPSIDPFGMVAAQPIVERGQRWRLQSLPGAFPGLENSLECDDAQKHSTARFAF